VKKLLLLLSLAGILVFALMPQWESYEKMGERRDRALNHLPSEILVGICWPFETNRDGMADGLNLALQEINSGHLTGGPPIRLVMRDDNFDWERAKDIAVEFSRTSRMSAVVGYYDDSVAVKASAIYESARMLNLIVGANSTPMTQRGFAYIVRTTLSSDKIGRALARMLVDRGYRKFALIWEEGAYGEDLAYRFTVSLDNLNAQWVYQSSYNRDRADFRLTVNELKGVDADVIFFAGLEPWAGDFIRQARRVGVKIPIVGAFSDTPEMRERAGPAINGAMYFDMYDPNSPSPENQEFVRKFRARYGRTPDTWAAQGYDALMILARAVKATDSANPLDLAYAIRYMDPWMGANGRYKFNSAGEMDDKPFYLNMYRNGQPVTIQASVPVPAPIVQ
jgi:branched-chain amino acid transport system substrate-binding protein